MTRARRWTLAGLSMVVAIAAFVLWARTFQVSAGDFAALLGRLHWWPIPLIAVLLAAHVGLAAWRWSLIELGMGGERPPFLQAFIVGAAAMGLGSLLPPPLVYVAARGLANRVNRQSGARGLLSGSLDQLSDLFAVGLFAAPAAVALLYRSLPIYLIGAAIALTAGALSMSHLSKIRVSPKLAGRLPKFLQVSLPQDLHTLRTIYLISVLRAINLTLISLAVAATCDAGSVEAIMIAVPLATLAISAAMLPGGIGVTEWSFSSVFYAFAMPPDAVVSFLLANRALLTALSLAQAAVAFAGGAMLFAGRESRRDL
jgi:hypothetical protein